jgi:transposase
MVECALEHGKSQAAREYRTTRKTVRKWVKRFKQEGLDGLKDKKKAAKHIPPQVKAGG